MGSHSLLQGIFLTQGSNPGLPHYGQILYHLSHKGSPRHREALDIRIGLPWCLSGKESIHLPVQETLVQSLVQEDSTCLRATKSIHHSCWACALEPGSCNYWNHEEVLSQSMGTGSRTHWGKDSLGQYQYSPGSQSPCELQNPAEHVAGSPDIVSCSLHLALFARKYPPLSETAWIISREFIFHLAITFAPWKSGQWGCTQTSPTQALLKVLSPVD